MEILENPDKYSITIGNIYSSLPTTSWIEERLANKKISQGEKNFYDELTSALDDAENAGEITKEELILGEELMIGGIRIEVLGVKNDDIIDNNVLNNASVVLRMSDACKSVLFTGDLGVEGGEKLRGTAALASRLPSDYVQMAHHGQRGVNKLFYQEVKPAYCLWPTPEGVWEYTTTKEVKGWMDEMGIPEANHYYMFDGLQTIK